MGTRTELVLKPTTVRGPTLLQHTRIQSIPRPLLACLHAITVPADLRSHWKARLITTALTVDIDRYQPCFIIRPRRPRANCPLSGQQRAARQSRIVILREDTMVLQTVLLTARRDFALRPHAVRGSVVPRGTVINSMAGLADVKIAPITPRGGVICTTSLYPVEPLRSERAPLLCPALPDCLGTYPRACALLLTFHSPSACFPTSLNNKLPRKITRCSAPPHFRHRHLMQRVHEPSLPRA